MRLAALILLLLAGTACAHTVTMNFAVRIGDTNNTARMDDREYNNVFSRITPDSYTSLMMYFEGSAGDNSSYGNNGTQNGADCSVEGKAGSSCRFDGIDDFISVSGPAGLPDGGSPRTVEFWIKTNTCDPGGTILHYGDGPGGGQDFIVQCTTINGTTKLFSDGINDANDVNISGSELPVYGNWNHMVFVFDGISGWVYYLNGLRAKNGTFPVLINTATPTVLTIGNRTDMQQSLFNGSIDELAVYGRGFTDSEAYAHFISSGPFLWSGAGLKEKYISVNRTDTLAAVVSAGHFLGAGLNTTCHSDVVSEKTLIMLHMDNSTEDSSGRNNDGLAVNVSCNVPGKIYGACYFNGINSYINFSKLDIGRDNYTIAMWVNTLSYTAVLFDQSNTTGHVISVRLSGGAAGFFTYEGGAADVSDTAMINDGSWHHVAVTKNGTNGSVYVDGLFRKSGVVANVLNTNESRLGSGQGGSEPLLGTMDEFVVYNRSLSQEEISDLYEHDPRYSLLQITQSSDSQRILLAATAGTYGSIERRLPMIAGSGLVSTTFGEFTDFAPNTFPLFLRLEYRDIDIENRLEWSGLGRLVITNAGNTASGIPNITLGVVR